MHKPLLYKSLCLVPPIGFVLYFLLFGVAAYHYPGGYVADPDYVGYHWLHNYWCDLSSHLATNGDVNEGQAYAVVAMVIACLCLALFYYLFSLHFLSARFWKIAVPSSGLLSSICAILIFTPLHDPMLLLALVFGLVPVGGIARYIFGSELILYKKSGQVLLALITANVFIYYTRVGIITLPLLQKITFVLALYYVGMLCIRMRKDWNTNSE